MTVRGLRAQLRVIDDYCPISKEELEKLLTLFPRLELKENNWQQEYKGYQISASMQEEAKYDTEILTSM